jgi:hypothetical protein
MHYGLELIDWLRTADEEALDQITSEFAKNLELRGRFNAFGDNRDSKASAELENGADDFLGREALKVRDDNDDAFMLALRTYPNRVGRTAAEEDRLWLDTSRFGKTDILMGPAAAPLRRDPRFLELAASASWLDGAVAVSPTFAARRSWSGSVRNFGRTERPLLPIRKSTGFCVDRSFTRLRLRAVEAQ